MLGTGPSVTVPPGHVYIVRTITVYVTTPLLNIDTFFEDDTSGLAFGHWQASAGNDTNVQLETRLVFEEGQGFHFQVDTAGTSGADCSAHGYDLIS